MTVLRADRCKSIMAQGSFYSRLTLHITNSVGLINTLYGRSLYIYLIEVGKSGQGEK